MEDEEEAGNTWTTDRINWSIHAFANIPNGQPVVLQHAHMYIRQQRREFRKIKEAMNQYKCQVLKYENNQKE